MPRQNLIILTVVLWIGIFLTAKISLKERIVLSTIDLVEKKGLESSGRDQLLKGALDGIMKQSPYYPYSAYIPPEEAAQFEDELQGVFAGIGITHLSLDKESGELWFTPLEGSPAWKGGLRFGDRIVKVNGLDLKSRSVPEICGVFRGKESSLVQITVHSRDSILNRYRSEKKEVISNEFTEIEVIRKQVQQDILCGYSRNEEGKWNYKLSSHPDIGYIRIDQFTDNTASLFLEALNTIKKEELHSLIIDLRGNPGGFIEEALNVVSPFLPEGAEIVTTRDREGKIKACYKAKKGEKYDGKVAVLIDGESASASEILAGALADHHRALIAGTRSYGKGTVQEIFSLPCNMGVLRLTDASWYRPSGASINRNKNALETDVWGITPPPELTVPLNPYQETAILLFRDLRSFSEPIPEEDRDAMNQLILSRAENADLFSENAEEESPAPPSETLLGDPQLERCIEALTEEKP